MTGKLMTTHRHKHTYIQKERVRDTVAFLVINNVVNVGRMIFYFD